MSARTVAAWATVLAVSVASLAWSGAASSTARQRLDSTRTSLVALRQQAAELDRLRSLTPRDEQRPAAPEDLPRRVSGVIRGCGLPAAALGSFDAGAASREGEAITRRASLVLQQVTLPQVGRFLSDWRHAEPRWAVASIEVTPRGEAPAAGGDLPLLAVITLESTIRSPEVRP